MRNFNRNTALGIGAVALILGAIGPWVSVLGLVSVGPGNDTELAIVIFGGIALLIVSALTGRFMRPVSILVGLGALAESVNTLVRSSQADLGELGELVSPGWGLYLTMLAGTYIILSTWIARQKTV